MDHSRVLLGNDFKPYTNYPKVGKVIHDMLRSDLTPHDIGMFSAGIELKLLFMGYGDGNISLLRTVGFPLPVDYAQGIFKSWRRSLQRYRTSGCVLMNLGCIACSLMPQLTEVYKHSCQVASWRTPHLFWLGLGCWSMSFRPQLWLTQKWSTGMIKYRSDGQRWVIKIYCLFLL